MLFDVVEDTPDIMIGKGQAIRIGYEYMWGTKHRKKLYTHVLPLNIHAKDMFKIRERTLRRVYAEKQEVLGGAQPVLYNCVLELLTD